MRMSALATAGIIAALSLVAPANAQLSADGRDRWVTVFNKSSFQTVVSIHAVPPHIGVPQTTDPDLIPNDTISPGRSLRIKIDNGLGDCVFNIRLTTNETRRPDWFFYGLNVCTSDSMTVHD